MPLTPTRLAPSFTAKSLDLNLEALRGFAALVVVWYHIILFGHFIDPHFQPEGIWVYLAPGHESVLIFFVLSGYVIALNTREPLTRATIPTYLKKRFVRIYPIYLISILIALLLAKQAYPGWTIFSHLLLLQGMTSELISQNSPAWSLHYEVLFYLLFIPLSYFRLNALLVTALCLLTGLINSLLGTAPQLTSYLYGFTFWMVGVVLARYMPHKTQPHPGQMLSLMFLWLALPMFNLLEVVISKVIQVTEGKLIYPDSVFWLDRIIKLADFSWLPYALLTIIIFTSKDFLGRKPLTWLLLALPAYKFKYLFQDRAHIDFGYWAFPVLFYWAAVFCYVFQNQLRRISSRFINWLSATGAISYGIYIIHFPVMHAFQCLEMFSGSAQTFWVRTVLFFIVTVILAYILEKIIQPRIKQLFK
ncbi:acyltransferase family protein [Hymenobacter fodinae]|uniref:Acyltransferase n=1 Tax=Hymenobacter fodinae TaxID=2510796 RepID=A0A4Z0P3H2_9BACT|nr:acyltransferase family protein [Hymenobacter fodinae]TGE04748.1 acyltransferase [Hymenobacter fodinae]